MLPTEDILDYFSKQLSSTALPDRSFISYPYIRMWHESSTVRNVTVKLLKYNSNIVRNLKCFVLLSETVFPLEPILIWFV